MKAIVGLAAFACTAQLAWAEDYAHVVSKSEIMGNVPVQQRVCENSTVQVQQPNSGAGAVIGGIAGGLLGNTVGGGSGNAVATAAGAITGAIVGNQLESQGNQPVTQQVQRCHLAQVAQSQVIGYNVTYEFGGKQYTTQVRNDPGDWLPVQVSGQGVYPVLPPAPPVQTVSISQPTVVVDPSPAVIYAPAPYPYYWGPAFSVGIGYGRHWGHGRRW